jgi:hypothetical protein
MASSLGLGLSDAYELVYLNLIISLAKSHRITLKVAFQFGFGRSWHGNVSPTEKEWTTLGQPGKETPVISFNSIRNFSCSVTSSAVWL